MYSIRGFENHMQRLIEVANADPETKNELLVGSENVYEDAKEYLKGVNIHSNNVIAREVLLTASPGFFKNNVLDSWKELNREWLLHNFKDNCIYATLHLDETTPHIHSLIVPKKQNKRGQYILSNRSYFNGKTKLSELQTQYHEAMQRVFKELQRGNKYSKMKHMDIKTWYSLINAPINDRDIKSLCAKAKNSELLEIKIKAIQRTLDAYKQYNLTTLSENEKLQKNNERLFKEVKGMSKSFMEADKESMIYAQAIKLIAKHYKINESKISQIVTHAKNSFSNSNEKTR
jgi:hypothetical protein